MRAARQFAQRLARDGHLPQLASLKAELYGSLGATGKGHGSDIAVILGLCGDEPDTVEVDTVAARVAAIRQARQLHVLGQQLIAFREPEHLTLHKRKALPYHPNGMIFEAFDAAGNSLSRRAYFSVGGGFIVDEAAIAAGFTPPDATRLRHPFTSAAQLLALCAAEGKTISQIMLENELAWRDEASIRKGLLEIWLVMQACVKRGCEREGILPGGMKVKRRAGELYRKLAAAPEAGLTDPLTVMDWVNLYALAVNEENAAGGRVVTAPTNGAAGIIPAVLHYYTRFVPGATEEGVIRFMLTAGAIGILFKLNASISGAEVGCQGEVGSACSMAAGALAEVLGGTPQQVENAAEIGMEHNLGLTCDPVGGLVQVPCIERNAMASIKAINAARMALRGDGSHFISLDRVIRTMRDTGRDMHTRYKETARGGLAIEIVEVPVNIVEC
ncbi:L-serine dehydratase [Silvimonas iriomotensis]|uniref:L-serine dehydratase n=2 Tax=Silvimonas iriomotensis TaxID=449662 RepID=A0ABQ2P7H5_9NEIS|nr:L-serine dehydratase [Silvimonas iriomotensis]